MLATVLPLDHGDIIIGGFSSGKNPKTPAKLIGVCPQDLALYPELSAMDNLVFFGRMEGLSGRKPKPRLPPTWN